LLEWSPEIIYIQQKKIARDCNILTEGGIAMEGKDFRNLQEEEMDDIIARLQVLARSSPEDKYMLVKRLRTSGQVVAVTGDGTNDAPALKEADVGLSMGITGTQVAKIASDIVIIDDNFTSIINSVKWGRSVYDNIRKFLQFQLTVNVVALLLAFFGAIFKFGTPLTAVQLLWVNLIMDTMAALALSTEQPTDDLLLRKPYGRGGSLITKIMIRNILSQAIYQFVLLMLLLFCLDDRGYHKFLYGVEAGYKYIGQANTHYTIIFNTFVFFQVFNEFNSRTVDRKLNIFENLFTNWIFISIIVLTVVVQFLMVQSFGNFTQCVPLTLLQWATSVSLAYFTLPIGYLVRIFVTPRIPVEDWEIPVKDNNNIFVK